MSSAERPTDKGELPGQPSLHAQAEIQREQGHVKSSIGLAAEAMVDSLRAGSGAALA